MPALIFTLCLLVFFGLLAFMARGFPWEAKFFPWLVLFPLVGMLAWQSVKEIRKLRKKGEKQGTEAKFAVVREEGPARHKYMAAIVWMLIFVAMVYFLGLMVGLGLFTFLYIKLNGGKWLEAIGVAAGITVFFYVAFVRLLEMYLYSGAVAEWLQGLIQG